MPRRWRKRVDYARQRFACVTWRQPRGPAVCRKCRLRAREQTVILGEAAVTNQAVCGCTPFSGLLNQFLFLFLLSQRQQFQAASEGGAQPNISKVKIVWTAFPLPPLAEQHRIVTKVDELMALCDRLEAARKDPITR